MNDSSLALESSILVMEVGETRYGLHAKRVLEIIWDPMITAMPKLPPYLAGVMNYKGAIVPVINLHALCLGGEGKDAKVCILFESGKEILAILVDAVVEMLLEDEIKKDGDNQTIEGAQLKFRYVLKGEKSVFVFDMDEMVDGLKEKMEAQ